MEAFNANSGSETHELVDRPVLLTTSDAAAYLGLACATLNKWRCHGGGPVFVKLGRAVRYRRDDLNAFLAERAKRSTSDV